MQPITKTCLFTASVSFTTAAALVALFYGWFELPVLLLTAAGFGALAATVSSIFVFFTVSRRMREGSIPVLGPVRGAVLALLTFALCLVPHAAFFTGAGGYLASLAGQLVLGLMMLGWLVVIVGAVMGLVVECLFLSLSLKSDM